MIYSGYMFERTLEYNLLFHRPGIFCVLKHRCGRTSEVSLYLSIDTSKTPYAARLHPRRSVRYWSVHARSRTHCGAE